MEQYREREKISDPGGVQTHELRKQITVALPTELQGQVEAGRGKLRWYFVVNAHVSEWDNQLGLATEHY